MLGFDASNQPTERRSPKEKKLVSRSAIAYRSLEKRDRHRCRVRYSTRLFAFKHDEFVII